MFWNLFFSQSMYLNLTTEQNTFLVLHLWSPRHLVKYKRLAASHIKDTSVLFIVNTATYAQQQCIFFVNH